MLIAGRLIEGHEWAVSGVFTLFAVLFFFVGVLFFALGLLGEYVGRIYLEVRHRPRYVIRQVIRSGQESEVTGRHRLSRDHRPPDRGPRSLVFGYHTMGCVGFDALLRHGFEVAAVLTHRDDPDEEIWWESLAERARGRGIPVHFAGKSDPKTPAFAELVAGYRPEFIFSFYFRYMIPEGVLRLAPRGAFNLHGSLLPRYRGRAPVNWVLVNGETETGVSLHHMVAMPDAGDLVDAGAGRDRLRGHRPHPVRASWRAPPRSCSTAPSRC